MPDDLLVEWGTRLRKTRRDRGLSVIEVARQAGINRQYLYRLEAGEKAPSDDVRIRIAAVLGVTVPEIWVYPNGGDPS